MTITHTDIRTPFWMKHIPTSWHPYFYLGRYDRPIGILILFFPCLWVFTLTEKLHNIPLLLLFFLGSILMRGAGCILNDMADRKFDGKIERTKMRPLAQGSLTSHQALVFLGVHLSLALLVLVQLNPLTIMLGIAALPLVMLYPFMKRWTYWPQAFLGLTFNWGVLMTYTETTLSFHPKILLIYGAAFFWTLGYDTIYGFQDKEGDLGLGLKSTALLFDKNPQTFLGLCFLIMFLLLALFGALEGYSNFYYGTLTLPLTFLLYKVWRLDTTNPSECLQIFRFQKIVGVMVFCAMLIRKL